MNVSPEDREVLRRLAARVAEAASLPVQQERAAMWKELNALHPRRPMVLAFAEGGWRELVTEQDLQCTDPLLRQWERHLRSQLFRHESIDDDWPLTRWFNIRWVVHHGDFGFPDTRTRSEELGSYVWDPPLKTRADVRRLHPRSVEVDRPETARQRDLAEEILGDLLRVRVHGSLWWSVGLTAHLIFLRGLQQVMYDMVDDPPLVHEVMALLRDDAMRELDLYESDGILSLNNGPDDYVGSGGVGCTDELPADGFAGTVRTADMWVLGESQETVGISPKFFEQFVLPYQLPLMNRFGLVCYGCCEPVERRLDLLTAAVPKLRRVSVSPWADRERAAEVLGPRYVFSWKPNPAPVCAPRADWGAAERAIRETLAMTRGCCVEMVLKDTHTFSGDRTRPGRWVAMARRAAEEAM